MPLEPDKENIDNDTLKILIDELHNSIEINRELNAALQNEIGNNRLIRVKLESDVEYLRKATNKLELIINSGDGNSLQTRVVLLEESSKKIDSAITKLHKIDSDVKIIKSRLTMQHNEQKTKAQRLWSLFIQNTPVILTWIGLGIMALIQYTRE